MEQSFQGTHNKINQKTAKEGREIPEPNSKQQNEEQNINGNDTLLTSANVEASRQTQKVHGTLFSN